MALSETLEYNHVASPWAPTKSRLINLQLSESFTQFFGGRLIPIRMLRLVLPIGSRSCDLHRLSGWCWEHRLVVLVGSTMHIDGERRNIVIHLMLLLRARKIRSRRVDANIAVIWDMRMSGVSLRGAAHMLLKYVPMMYCIRVRWA